MERFERYYPRGQELTLKEREIILPYMLATLYDRLAGSHDMKYFPINEQIREEENLIGFAQYDMKKFISRLNEGLGEIKNYFKIPQLNRAYQLLSKRRGELIDKWEFEDRKIREQSGAQWEDLWEALEPFNIKPIDVQNLRRPIWKSIYGDPEEESPDILYDFHYIESTDKRTKILKRPKKVIEQPKHELHFFGNEVHFCDEGDFDEIVRRLGLEDAVKYQIAGSQVSSTTFTQWFSYRIVVPYKNWIFVEYYFEDTPPALPKDEGQKFVYWEDSLIPNGPLIEEGKGWASELISLDSVEVQRRLKRFLN